MKNGGLLDGKTSESKVRQQFASTQSGLHSNIHYLSPAGGLDSILAVPNLEAWYSDSKLGKQYEKKKSERPISK